MYFLSITVCSSIHIQDLKIWFPLEIIQVKNTLTQTKRLRAVASFLICDNKFILFFQ